MEEIGYICSKPTVVYEDNEAAIAVANNPRNHDRMKHIELKLHLVRDAIHDKKVIMTHISGTEQIADLSTMALPVKLHDRFTNQLMTSMDERK